MATQRRTATRAPHLELAARLLRAAGQGEQTLVVGALPSPREIAALVEDLLTVFFPESGRSRALSCASMVELQEHLASVLAGIETQLEEAVFLSTHRRCAQVQDGCRKRARAVTSKVMRALPDIRAVLTTDVRAAFDNDPAATGTDEIVACYPGLYAIAVYRLAHALLREGAQVLPRMLTEHAHARTGIDIHPGATIGPSFFIDHGTGIVIGETSVIGKAVRVYQGVTLGALSVRGRASHKPGGTNKRHPTIEDDVIIYANATILGGNTVIGRGAVVGGNAWITYSVPAGVRVGVGT